MRLIGARFNGRWRVTLATPAHTATQTDAATLADALRAVQRMAREAADGATPREGEQQWEA